MRIALIISLIGISSVARADTTPLLDARTIDAPCRTLAHVPHNERTSGPDYDAAISTANCIAMTRAQSLQLTPTPASVAALDAAVAPAVAILDRVIETGDAEHQLIAQYAKADLYKGNTARILAAVPQPSPQMTREEVANRDATVHAADTLTQPWRQHALECRRAIARLVIANPELATQDRVLARMIADSRIVEAAGLASR
jgi:hypothetical protein